MEIKYNVTFLISVLQNPNCCKTPYHQFNFSHIYQIHKVIPRVGLSLYQKRETYNFI